MASFASVRHHRWRMQATWTKNCAVRIAPALATTVGNRTQTPSTTYLALIPLNIHFNNDGVCVDEAEDVQQGGAVHWGANNLD